MSYRPGNMGMSDAIALVFMVTISRVFLTGLPRLLESAGQLLWLVIVVAGTVSIGVALAMIYVAEHVSGDLLTITERLWGRAGAWIVGLFYMVVFWANAVVLLRQYAEHTLLTALPSINFLQSLLWYVIPAVLFIYLGIEAISRTMWLLLPFISASFIIVWLCIFPYAYIYNLFPWGATGYENVIQAVITGPGADVGVMLILIFAPMFQDARYLRTGVIFGMVISTAVNTITALMYVLVFGVNVGQEKILPFFELARLAYLSRYVQHLEAVFIVTWVISGVMAFTISMYIGLYIISRLTGLPSFRPITLTVAMILVFLSMTPTAVNNIIYLDQQWVLWSNIGVYIIPGLLFITFLFKRNKRSDTCAPR